MSIHQPPISQTPAILVTANEEEVDIGAHAQPVATEAMLGGKLECSNVSEAGVALLFRASPLRSCLRFAVELCVLGTPQASNPCYREVEKKSRSMKFQNGLCLSCTNLENVRPE